MQKKKGQEDTDFVHPVLSLVTLFSDFLRQISSTMYSDNRFMDVTEWNTSYGFIKGYFHFKEIVGIELKFLMLYEMHPSQPKKENK